LIEWLYGIDIAVFRLLNTGIVNPVGDLVFPFLSEVRNFYVIYLVGLLYILYRFRMKGLVIVGLLIVCVVVSDQLSSFVIKPLVNRIRPCSSLDNVRTLIGCGSGKSFPSSHAVNNFAIVFILAHFFPKARIWLFVFAALVAISRVYVGVHYPSDILAGAAIGMAIGWGLLSLYIARMKIVHALQRTFVPKHQNP
jgi:undecaprenyl-diphosphatase